MSGSSSSLALALGSSTGAAEEEKASRAGRHAGFVGAARAHARATASGRSGGEASALVAAVSADARGLWLVASHARSLASRLTMCKGRKGALEAPAALEGADLDEARAVVRDLDLAPGTGAAAAVAGLARLGLTSLVLGTERDAVEGLDVIRRGGEAAGAAVASALGRGDGGRGGGAGGGVSADAASRGDWRGALEGVYLPEVFELENGWLGTSVEEEVAAARVDEDARLVREGCADAGCTTRGARRAHAAVGVCLAIDDGLEATREVDDAVGLDVVERADGSGVFDEWVTVAIADPAEGLRKGRRAEVLARAKSSSVYLAHGSYNMMPSRLSVAAYSLRHQVEDQDVFLIRARIGPGGELSEATVGDGCTPGGITRMTYAMVDQVLAGQEADGSRAFWEDEGRVQAFYRERLGGADRGAPRGALQPFPGDARQLLGRLRAVTDRRRAHRFRGGATSFSFPKPRPSLRKDPRTGLYTDVVGLGNDNAGIRHSVARKLVEESMILGGSTCARWAFDRGVPIPYRSMHGGQTSDDGGAGDETATDPLVDAVRRAERSGLAAPSALRLLGGAWGVDDDNGDANLGAEGLMSADSVDIGGLDTVYVSRAERDQPRVASALDPALPGTDLARQLELIRGLPNAATTVRAVPHMAVGLGLYTQATSPVRRFRDVLVHQQIKAAAQGFPPPYTLAELSAVLPKVELSIRRADMMMESSDKYWTLRYLRDVVLKRRTRLRAVTVAVQYRNPVNAAGRFFPLSALPRPRGYAGAYAGADADANATVPSAPTGVFSMHVDPGVANPGDTLTVFLVDAAGLRCSAKCMTHTRIGEPIYVHVAALIPDLNTIKLVQAPGLETPDVASGPSMFQPDDGI